MIRAVQVQHRKWVITHKDSDQGAIVEVKVWDVQNSKKYPDGIRYSLFCIDKDSFEVVIGIDNHFPKGHHLHIDGKEEIYYFRSFHDLLEDFYLLLRKKGYKI